MFCSFCGTIIADDQKKCPVCGTVNEAPEVIETPVEASEAAPIATPVVTEEKLESTPVVTMEEASPYANYVPETQYASENSYAAVDANAPEKAIAKKVLALGIVAFAIIFMIPIAFLPSLIIAIVALKKSKQFRDYPNVDGAKLAKVGKIFATVALILSIISIVFVFPIFVVLVVLFVICVINFLTLLGMMAPIL